MRSVMNFPIGDTFERMPVRKYNKFLPLKQFVIPYVSIHFCLSYYDYLVWCHRGNGYIKKSSSGSK